MIDGDPQTIIIDDQIVVGLDQFSAFTQGKLWVLLLEKAWAKAHVTYKDSIRGDVFEIFRDLTGAPSCKFDLTKGDEPNFDQVS